jgi:hypothetical protein
VSCDLLREGAPIEPVPPISWKPDCVVSDLLSLVLEMDTITHLHLFFVRYSLKGLTDTNHLALELQSNLLKCCTKLAVKLSLTHCTGALVSAVS